MTKMLKFTNSGRYQEHWGLDLLQRWSMDVLSKSSEKKMIMCIVGLSFPYGGR